MPEITRAASIVDLGCGDGALIWALRRAGAGGSVYAVDVAPDRVRRAEKAADGISGVVSDATRTPLPDSVADGVIASQLIEHLPDDRALVFEIVRLLRPGGWCYVGTVLRGPRSFWIYRRDARWWLDPTHVREYGTQAEFARAVSHPDLEIEETNIEKLRFAVPDLMFRSLAFARVIPFESLSKVYERAPRLQAVREAVRIRVPGYSLTEIWLRKGLAAGHPNTGWTATGS